MNDLRFISFAPHRRKVKSFLWLLGSIIVLVAIGFLFTIFWYDVIEYIPGLSLITNHIKNAITDVSLIGLFYGNFIGGLFFIPSPDELIFYYALVKGNPFWLAIIFAASGYMIAQVLNYSLGKKLSDPMLTFVSKEKVYKFRRMTHKYGAMAVFLFNVAPLPAPLLSLALGIAKYNFSRLMLWTALGKIIKYSVVCIFFFIVT